MSMSHTTREAAPAERPTAFTVFGVISMVLAALTFVVGLVIFLNGVEAAILLMIIAFGLVTLATGLLAVSR